MWRPRSAVVLAVARPGRALALAAARPERALAVARLALAVPRPGLALALAAALVLGPAAPARAHRVTPEEVIAELAAPAARASHDVVSVARDPRLPRLLVVRVGPRWPALDPALRRKTAEAWRERWRHAVADGVLAVTNASGGSLVSFDAAGRAQLRDVPPSPAQPGAPGG